MVERSADFNKPKDDCQVQQANELIMGETADMKVDYKKTYGVDKVLNANSDNAIANSTVTRNIQLLKGLISSLVPTSRKINGKSLKEDITLSAKDVGALPNTVIIPSKLSQLQNDIDLPENIDLENYYTKGEINNKLEDKVSSKIRINNKELTSNIELTAFDVKALSISTAIPSKVSELENDKGYTSNIGSVTSIKINNRTLTPDLQGIINIGNLEVQPQELERKANKDELLITQGSTNDRKNVQLKEGTSQEFLTEHQDISNKVNRSELKAVAFSGSYNDLTDVPRFKTIGGQSIIGYGDIPISTNPNPGTQFQSVSVIVLEGQQFIGGMGNMESANTYAQQNPSTLFQWILVDTDSVTGQSFKKIIWHTGDGNFIDALGAVIQ